MLIPVYDDQRRIIETVTFIDNLTLSDAPDYVNENGQLGLTRKDGVLYRMYYSDDYPNTSYAYEVTEEEAYEICLNRGRLYLVDELQITPDYKEEVTVL